MDWVWRNFASFPEIAEPNFSQQHHARYSRKSCIEKYYLSIYLTDSSEVSITAKQN